MNLESNPSPELRLSWSLALLRYVLSRTSFYGKQMVVWNLG